MYGWWLVLIPVSGKITMEAKGKAKGNLHLLKRE
jgi:hypothetical protein